jgi:hypothetical protein
LVRDIHRNGRRRVKFEAKVRAKTAGRKGKGKGEEERDSFLTTRHFRRWQQFRKPKVPLEGRRPPNGDDSPSEKKVEEHEGTEEVETPPPPATDNGIVKAVRAKSHPPGFGSLGVHVLHMKVAIGSPDATPIKGRLDSGADITLMSEEYFLSLGYLPKPREGLRMRLYALTGEARVLGFTKFTMYS